MTIRFPASLGIEMKRLLLVFLAALFLLTACGEKDPTVFLCDVDGYGITDTETGIHYTALPSEFEPSALGAVRGAYTNEKSGAVFTYYEIPSLDPTQYLADEERNVWCALEVLPSPAALTPTAILFFEERAISVESMRFSADTEGAVVGEICTLWFEGEATAKPEGDMSYTRRVKIAFAELPNVYYCFSYVIWGEQAYFYDLFADRTVAVPADLAARFPRP